MDTQFRKIPEVNYLNVENTPRYRAILSYFFKQHERMRHALYPDDVLQHLQQLPGLDLGDYSEDKLHQDLETLVEFGNLTPHQDPSRVSTIREFRNKKYRYQATRYTIEIERMVAQLANLSKGIGGSLELSLFDRILESLSKLLEQGPGDGQDRFTAFSLPPEQLNRLWEDLYNYFRAMGNNASDYLAHLKDANIEEQMKTDAFLAFKDAFINYLRNFILGLQKAADRILGVLQEASDDFVQELALRLADYQISIPRLQQEQLDRDALAEEFRERWKALEEWFSSSSGRTSECHALMNETTEAIRRVARFAQRLGERLYHAHSRRRDYEHLAFWFSGMTDLDEAHRLSAAVFGVAFPRHLVLDDKGVEDMDSTIWEQPACERLVEPRVRNYKSRSRPRPAKHRRKQQKEMLEAYLKERQAEQQLIDDLLKRGSFSISALGEVDPHVRKTLLGWISRCYQSSSRSTTTDAGITLTLREEKTGRTVLVAEDGTLEMPDLVFEQGGKL